MNACVWTRTAPALKRDWPIFEGSNAAADLVIIGAGYTGLSTALYAARNGLETVVLEAEQPGAGASGRNAAGWGSFHLKKSPSMIEATLSGDAGRKMSAFIGESGSVLRAVIESESIDCDFTPCGVAVAAHVPSARAGLRILAEEWSIRGNPVEVLDRSEMRELFKTDRFDFGVLIQRAGTLQPLAYARGLADRAVEAGVRGFAGSTVTAIRRDGNRWAVRTNFGSLQCRIVVLATDAYTDTALWPGLARAMYRIPYAMFASEPMTDAAVASMVASRIPLADSNPAQPLWISFDRENRLVVSAPPPRRDCQITALAEQFAHRLGRIFPGAPVPHWETHWYGQIGLSPNELPRIIQLSENAYAPGGYSGQGIGAATALGRELAELVSGTRASSSRVPLVPLEKLRFARLAPWALRQIALPLARASDKTYR